MNFKFEINFNNQLPNELRERYERVNEELTRQTFEEEICEARVFQAGVCYFPIHGFLTDLTTKHDIVLTQLSQYIFNSNNSNSIAATVLSIYILRFLTSASLCLYFKIFILSQEL